MTHALHGGREGSPLDEAKKALRSQLLARLKNEIAPEVRRAYARDLCRQAAAVLQSEAARRGAGGEKSLHVALYAPMEHEADLLPLLEQFPQHCFHFPLCLPGRVLVFRHVRRPCEDFEAGLYGIRSPLPSRPACDPAQLDVVFVPGVAFTPEGHRLGYGGGYYDRFLPRCPQAVALSCVFPEQLVASLPVGKHDLPVNRLLIAGQREETSGK